ncbi:MAG: hypothetical protein KDD55_00370 [Bdellovibrionales bacterium]|nr:hypothetical protein [Bdellovibrionales bacterium]
MQLTRAVSYFLILCCVSCIAATASARDIEYKNNEFSIYVTPGEPTQMEFPDDVSGGFRKKLSSLSLDKKDSSLIIFANESISEDGEAIIVRLKDGRSYSVRIRLASDSNPRDSLVRLYDERSSILSSEEEELPFAEKKFDRSSPHSPSGLIREMVLAAEFGKPKIPGYKISERYKGETVMNDGTLTATIDKIFIGPNYWGYVIDASNQLDEGQRLNPATFRLDGTRAVSMDKWELAPKPLNIEQQIARDHKAKVYVVTTPRQ